jgi:ABC-type multidrug transport system fused ATPase/permease subunit
LKRLENLSDSIRVWRRFSEHLRQHHLRLTGVALLILLSVSLELVRPWTVAWVVDNALVRGKPLAHEPFFYVWTGAVAGALIVLVRSYSDYLSTLLATRVGHSVSRSLRNAIFGHLADLPPSFHARHKSGDLLVRLMGDVPILKTMLVDSSAVIASRSIMILGAIVMSFRVDPVTSAVILVLLPLVVLTVKLIAKELTQAVRKQRRKEGRMADYLHEAIAASLLIQSLGRATDTAEIFAKSNRSAARAEMRTTRLAAVMTASVESMLGIALAIALGLGAWRVLAGKLSIGELTVLLSYIRTMAKPIRSAAKHADKVAKGTACGDRILEILDAEIELSEPEAPLEIPERARSLEFQSVSYTYADGSSALTSIDAEFKAGELSALFGRSGAGKSTMAALAARLFDPTSGRVLFGGIDVKDFRLQEYRDVEAYDLQEPILFGETIRENLLLGTPDASEEALFAACKLAAADTFIEGLPDGLDTVLGTGGVGLSGGERRRLCLARTFLRKAQLVIVDEPFVGLDTPTAERVRESLQELAKERIVIVITHETQQLEDFDHILFLEGGRAADSGLHEDLLLKSPGYRRATERSGARVS